MRGLLHDFTFLGCQRTSLPSVTKIPVNGADDETQCNGEGEADSVVEGRAPVRQHILLEQQCQLTWLALREGMLEVQRVAAARRLCQPSYQLLILSAHAHVIWANFVASHLRR